MQSKDGGQAFPLQGFSDGMTLRDYFAAKTLCGWMADSNSAVVAKDVMARACYGMADAMLKERERR